jgi:DNA-directed RNA polymerase subunit RPC12/RpoP
MSIKTRTYFCADCTCEFNVERIVGALEPTYCPHCGSKELGWREIEEPEENLRREYYV